MEPPSEHAPTTGRPCAGGVKLAFVRQLWSLLRIAIPREGLALLGHGSFLVARTALSLRMARVDAQIINAVVQQSAAGFARSVVGWLLIALPTTLVTHTLRFIESHLALAFRTRLTEHANELYMTRSTFYRAATGGAEQQASFVAIDQTLTADIKDFSALVAHIHSHLSMPLLDLIMLARELRRIAGARTLAAVACLIALSAKCVWVCAPDFDHQAREEARLEGKYRTAHARLTAQGEAIAVSGGQAMESRTLHRRFAELADAVRSGFTSRLPFACLETFMFENVWDALGVGMCAITLAFQQTQHEQHDHHDHGHDHDHGHQQEPQSGSTPEVSVVPLPSLMHGPGSVCTDRSHNHSHGSARSHSQPPGPAPAVQGQVQSQLQSFLYARGLVSAGAQAVQTLLTVYSELGTLAAFTARVAEALAGLRALVDLQEGEQAARAAASTAVQMRATRTPDDSGQHSGDAAQPALGARRQAEAAGAGVECTAERSAECVLSVSELAVRTPSGQPLFHLKGLSFDLASSAPEPHQPAAEPTEPTGPAAAVDESDAWEVEVRIEDEPFTVTVADSDDAQEVARAFCTESRVDAEHVGQIAKALFQARQGAQEHLQAEAAAAAAEVAGAAAKAAEAAEAAGVAEEAAVEEVVEAAEAAEVESGQLGGRWPVLASSELQQRRHVRVTGNLLVCGPSGCGKSSLLRVLKGGCTLATFGTSCNFFCIVTICTAIVC
jgi:ABC-type uncharacterized transport system fused permease/ATPase subunit